MATDKSSPVASRVGEVLKKRGKKPSLLEGWVDAGN